PYPFPARKLILFLCTDLSTENEQLSRRYPRSCPPDSSGLSTLCPPPIHDFYTGLRTRPEARPYKRPQAWYHGRQRCLTRNCPREDLFYFRCRARVGRLR